MKSSMFFIRDIQNGLFATGETDELGRAIFADSAHFFKSKSEAKQFANIHIKTEEGQPVTWKIYNMMSIESPSTSTEAEWNAEQHRRHSVIEKMYEVTNGEVWTIKYDSCMYPFYLYRFKRRRHKDWYQVACLYDGEIISVFHVTPMIRGGYEYTDVTYSRTE